MSSRNPNGNVPHVNWNSDKVNFRWGGGLNKHKIFEKIISAENLFLAWKEFRRGKGKKSEVQQFEFNLEDNLFQLREELLARNYQPQPYSAFYIQDPKLRHIHKASVRDRVLFQAVFRILYPIFDGDFIYDSYSSRVGKGTHKAVDRLHCFFQKCSRNNSRTIFALKCDIRKFFDSINHDILMDLIKNKIDNEEAIWLIEKIIKSYNKGENCGLPLGNVTSQLFANIYLNELDRYIKHKLKIKYYLRYCDDFIILSQDRHCFEKIVKEISLSSENSLKLKLHPQKIIIRRYSEGVDFLGYVLRPYYRILRTNTKRRLLRKVNEKNLPSYLGILKHCAGYKIKKKIKL